MTVQYILGRAGCGKTRWCIEAIAKALRAGGEQRLVFLVPEQATFEAERAILSAIGGAGSGFSRLQVLSFNRLAYRLSPHRQGAQLSAMGQQMILSLILSQQGEQMRIFRPIAQKPGLAGTLGALIGRLEQADCTPAGLRAMAAETLAKEPGNLSALKFDDIATIYTAYRAFFEQGSGFVNPDQHLSAAGQQIRPSGMFEGCRLWVDGFSDFTIVQRNCLMELIRAAQATDIAFCVDAETIDIDTLDAEQIAPAGLFAPTERTLADLTAILRQCHIELARPVALPSGMRFKASAALGQIESHLYGRQECEKTAAGGAVELVKYPTVRAEAMGVAQQIARLVRECGYRYRDIAVIVPSLALYQDYLQAAFERYSVAYFLDRPRELATHPAVELLTAALEAVRTGLPTAAMQTYLKRSLCGLSQHQADMLDAYCKAAGIRTADWNSKQDWPAGIAESLKMDAAQIEAGRRQLTAPLVRLRERFAERLTASDAAAAVWEYLEGLDIRKRLEEQSQTDADDEQYAHRRLWKKLVELLDEFCLVFGSQRLEPAAALDILTQSLKSLTLKQIPAALDQVLVGSIERSRHPDIRAAFVVGATQIHFPAPLPSEGILTDADLRFAAQRQFYLGDSIEQGLSNRRYLAYIALTRPSRKLVISYPAADEKAKVCTGWGGLERIAGLFSDVGVRYQTSEIADAGQLLSGSDAAEWITGALGADAAADTPARPVAAALLAAVRGGKLAALDGYLAMMEQALAYRNRAVLDLPAEQIARWPFYTSVSQLETFAACPYQYFASYVLGLSEQKRLSLEPVDIGTLYHTLLSAVFERLRLEGLNWHTAEPERLCEWSRQEAERLFVEDAQLAAFLRQGPHWEFIIRQAVSRLESLLRSLAAMCGAGQFRQTAAEYKFGGDNAYPTIKLESGKEVRLTGYIDRLDTANIDGRLTALIFDYKKSQAAKFNWREFYHGLDLQLAVYLLAALDIRLGGRRIEQVAGAFYVPIEKSYEKASSVSPDTDEMVIHKSNGVFNGQFADSLDAENETGWSRFYNFGRSKEGQYGWYGISGAVRPASFEVFLKRTRELIGSQAKAIASGVIDIKPYCLGMQTPCSNCDFRALCKFDWQINDYRNLEAKDKFEVLGEPKKGKRTAKGGGDE